VGWKKPDKKGFEMRWACRLTSPACAYSMVRKEISAIPAYSNFVMLDFLGRAV